MSNIDFNGLLNQVNNKTNIGFFIPNEKQELFFRSKNKERYVLGGNRTGKSTIGALEAISFCLGYRPYLSSTDPNYKTPFEPSITNPIRGIVTTESFGISGTANLVIKEKLHELIPKGVLSRPPKKNQQGVPVLYSFRNGSELHIMAYEQDTNKFEGARYHFWWGDENPPQDKYFSIQRGLTDFGGYYWITTTPISEPWTYDGLFLNDRVSKFPLSIDDNIKHKREWYGLQEWTGQLTEEDVADLIAKYRKAHMDEGEIQSRITGKFKHLEGLVLNNFDPEIHLIEPFDLPNDCSIYIAIDPHPKKPWCIMFLAVFPNGKMYVTKILFIRALVEEAVRACIIELGDKKPQKTIIDPYAVMNDPQTGKSLLTDVREKSEKRLIPISASKDKIRGIQAIRSALHHDLDRGIEPMLYFFRTEREGIKQLQSWVIDDSGKAAKKDDDAGENLYRLMLLHPKFKPASMVHKYAKDFSKRGSIAY